MAFLVRLLRIVFLVFLARLVLRAVAAWLAGRAAPAPRAGGGVPLVRDRVCNTFLPRERALSATLAGEVQYFCSAECLERAQAALGRAS